MRPRFRRPYPYRRSGSSRLLPLRSTRRFCRRGAGLGTPALAFDRCTAPVKLPTRQCPRIGWGPHIRVLRSHKSGLAPPRRSVRSGLVPSNRVSKGTTRVVVFHRRRSPASHLCYASRVPSQCRTRVKLNRVFFPRRFFQARSLGSGFARR